MTRNTRILQLVTRLDPGGAQAIAIDLARHQAAAGHDVTLAAGPGGQAEDAWTADIPCRVVRLRALSRPVDPMADTKSAWDIAALLVRHDIEVIHTHTSKAGFVGRMAATMAGTPVRIHTAHGWAFHPGQTEAVRRAYVALERLAAPWTTRLVAVSEATRDRGLAVGVGKPEQYAVSYCGVDPGPPPAPRAPTGLVGCIGNLKPQKAPDEFVRIAAGLARHRPDLRFELVGDGELRPDVEALARELGVDVALPGWCFDVAERLRRYDLLVLPSRFEGLPLSVLEAMAAGVPVLATAVDGTPEAIDDGATGRLYTPGDVGAAVDAARALLSDPGPVIAAARAAVVERFPRSRHLDEMTALATRLAGEIDGRA